MVEIAKGIEQLPRGELEIAAVNIVVTGGAGFIVSSFVFSC